MSDNTTGVSTPATLPACPDDWAKLHVFINKNTGQVIPARCKRWSCLSCAKVNYYKVDYLAAAGLPERFITLTRAGNTPKEINHNLKHLVQGIRRKGLLFEYFACIELHRNGLPHIHLFQRGDFIEQVELSKMWGIYTSKSFFGRSSTIVDIRYIREKQNVKGYLLKYLKKTWAADNHDDKSWSNLQEKFPGLNHYRHSRNWLPAAVKPEKEWYLVSEEAYKTGRYFLEVTPDTLQSLSVLGKLLPSKVDFRRSEGKGEGRYSRLARSKTLAERSDERNTPVRVVVDNNPYQSDFDFIPYYNAVMKIL